MLRSSHTPFKGKVALVTGGSRGIGACIAVELAREGADVAINYLRNEEAAKNVNRQIKRLGRKALLLRANVGNVNEISEMFGELKKVFGKLDIFIHCASLGIFKPILNVTMPQLTRIMSVNANSLIGCSREASKLMNNGGHIVAVSSLGSQRYITAYGAVGMAKASLEAGIRYLAVELAPKRIRVNAISGGPIDTQGLHAFPNYKRRKEECIAITPFGRLGIPEDIARIALFLCRQDSYWICGQIIIADGGLSLRLLSL